MAQRVIFHVDANSAFLSWSAAYRVKVLGEAEDLRDVPSVVAGDKASRHSIILAKSGPAKKYGIQTGEPLFQALEKCPHLKIIPPDYPLYVEASRHFVNMLRQFSPTVEQYSIDEAWVDMSGTERLWGAPRIAAEAMRKRIWDLPSMWVSPPISCWQKSPGILKSQIRSTPYSPKKWKKKCGVFPSGICFWLVVPQKRS